MSRKVSTTSVTPHYGHPSIINLFGSNSTNGQSSLASWSGHGHRLVRLARSMILRIGPIRSPHVRTSTPALRARAKSKVGPQTKRQASFPMGKQTYARGSNRPKRLHSRPLPVGLAPKKKPDPIIKLSSSANGVERKKAGRLPPSPPFQSFKSIQTITILRNQTIDQTLTVADGRQRGPAGKK